MKLHYDRHVAAELLDALDSSGFAHSLVGNESFPRRPLEERRAQLRSLLAPPPAGVMMSPAPLQPVRRLVSGSAESRAGAQGSAAGRVSQGGEGAAAAFGDRMRITKAFIRASVLAHTGARVGEVALLEPEDLRLKERAVLMPTEKHRRHAGGWSE
jgi:hypothetical protein